MNDFLQRSYHELVRDALTRLIGGVAGEAFVFRPELNEAGFALEQAPVEELLRVSAVDGGRRLDFALDDLSLDGEGRHLRFVGGTRPEPETAIHVDYLPRDASSPISDVNVGSVARTLVESLGRELALFYEKLERVYLDGFVDTARGESLDQVVALLGVDRIYAGRPRVELTFSRLTPAPGDVAIPAGTIVSTGVRPAGEVRFETTAARVLRQGTRAVDVPAQAVAESAEAAVGLAARTLTVVPRPLIGVEQVTNHAAPRGASDDETDEALRVRAKMALQRAGKGTLQALRAAILDEGALSAVLRDQPRGVPGEVDAVVDLPTYEREDERRAHEDRVLRAIDRTRAAGIRVLTGFARKVFVQVGRLQVVLRAGLSVSAAESAEIRAGVRRSLAEYVTRLAIGEEPTRSALIAAALGDVRLQEAVLDELETYQEDRLTRTPGDASGERRVHDTPLRLLDAAGVPLARLDAGLPFDRIRIAPDEKASLILPDAIELIAKAVPPTSAVLVDVELRVVPHDAEVDREALRERVAAQRIEPTLRAFFARLRDGESVRLAELLELLGSTSYELQDASLEALYVRDRRVLLGVQEVPVTAGQRAELRELRVR